MVGYWCLTSRSIGFPRFYYEGTWWRLFLRCVVHTKFEIYVSISTIFQLGRHFQFYILINEGRGYSKEKLMTAGCK